MTNLDVRIDELRKQMEDTYHMGETENALVLSRRLDRLIALAQRERMPREPLSVFAKRDKASRR